MLFLSIAFIIPAICWALPSEKPSANSVEERLAELLEGHHDVPTGKFREVRLDILLKEIGGIARFHERGFSSISRDITCLHYQFNGTKDDPEVSRYGFDLYVTGPAKTFHEKNVIAALVTYITPSRMVYYRSVAPMGDTPPHVFLKILGLDFDRIVKAATNSEEDAMRANATKK